MSRTQSSMLHAFHADGWWPADITHVPSKIRTTNRAATTAWYQCALSSLPINTLAIDVTEVQASGPLCLMR